MVNLFNFEFTFDKWIPLATFHYKRLWHDKV